jgi:hypothetical protein
MKIQKLPWKTGEGNIIVKIDETKDSVDKMITLSSDSEHNTLRGQIIILHPEDNMNCVGYLIVVQKDGVALNVVPNHKELSIDGSTIGGVHIVTDSPVIINN